MVYYESYFNQTEMISPKERSNKTNRPYSKNNKCLYIKGQTHVTCMRMFLYHLCCMKAAEGPVICTNSTGVFDCAYDWGNISLSWSENNTAPSTGKQLGHCNITCVTLHFGTVHIIFKMFLHNLIPPYPKSC